MFYSHFLWQIECIYFRLLGQDSDKNASRERLDPETRQEILSTLG